jgi:hypothetical protein
MAGKYDGQLQHEITMPMCSLIAKVFKVLSQSKVSAPRLSSPLLSPLGQVYVSNVYKSERGDQCVKCSYKTNDGLLFPLQKLLIFIHKPTIVLRYEDVESVEFLRVAANALSGGPLPLPSRRASLTLHSLQELRPPLQAEGLCEPGRREGRHVQRH